MNGTVAAFAAFLSSLRERVGTRALLLGGALALGTAVTEAVAVSLVLPLLDRLLRGGGTVGGMVSAAGGGGALPTALLLTALLAVTVGRAVLTWLKNNRLSDIRIDYVTAVRRHLFEQAARADWVLSRAIRPARIQTVLTEETDRLESGILFTLEMPGQVAVMLGYLAVAAIIAPDITAGAVVLGAAALGLTRLAGSRSAAMGESLSQAWEDYLHHIREFIAGLRVTKIFGIEDREIAGFSRNANRLAEEQRSYGRYTAGRGLRGQIATGVGAVGFLAVGLALPDMAVSKAMVVALIVYRVAPMLHGLDTAVQQVLHALPALRATERFVADCTSLADTGPGATEQGKAWQMVRLDRIAFRHAPHERWVHRDFSLDLPRGSATVLVGESGSGKSTLLDLLAGLLAPEEGAIRIDGAPLGPEGLPAWRAGISYVPQQAHLFDDTIRANLEVAAPGADEAQLWAALAAARARDFVAALPRGLDSPVGPDGSRLSGGERQRIALARALLRCPRLLLLDEPTSALDPENAALVLEAIAALKGRLTIVLATHHQSGITFADTIVRMDNPTGD